MSFSYANPMSGPSAGGIGWFDFGNLTMVPGDSVTGLTGTLNNGNIVTFDMALSLVSGTARPFNATALPTYPVAQFGVAGYTGISGNVAMYAAEVARQVVTSRFTISNITVKTPGGDNVPNYSVLIADTEATNLFEGIEGQTNGSPWNLLASVGAVNAPTLNGVGTPTFNIVGNQQFGPQIAYVLNTQAASQIILTLADQDPFISRQGFCIGFATTRVALQKNIGQRIDTSDQFDISIAGTPSDQFTTTGGTNGLQPELAQVYTVPDNTFTLTESMALGSASTLSDYNVTVSASNATLAGTIPPIGPLPIAFTPALGDDVIYTFLNAIPEVFTKTVDKAYADIGDILTYTITVDNPNSFAINNVLVTDSTPAGTSYLGNLTVDAPYSGTDLASGITITTIPAASSVTLSWQVKVNTMPPFFNPITNYANIVIPGGTSGMTNVVTTQIRHAEVMPMKLVDKAYAKPNDIITYTLILQNAGNVTANNVVLTDPLPAGTMLVPGSVTGAVGTPPTLTLTNPIPAAGSATVTFQVKIIGIPTVNPIPNTASLSYNYTVNPNEPNDTTATKISNTVTTLVSIAKLNTIKSVNKKTAYLGDTITYQIAVKNIGNVPANNAILTDLLPVGISFIPGTLLVNVPYTGTLVSGIALTNPVAVGETVTLEFQAMVDSIPNPNPAINQASINYTYTTDPQNPDGETDTSFSNKVCTLVFRYNFAQQISDITESVALEQAALAALINAEGAKIQKLIASDNVSQQELLCLNQSVADTIDSITMLETILQQKLGIFTCQMQGCNEPA